MLKQLLISNSILTEEQHEEAVAFSLNNNVPLYETLITEELCNEETLLRFLSNQLHLSFDLIDKTTLDYKIAQLIPENYARAHHILPLFQIGNTVTIAISKPFKLEIIEDLEHMTSLAINPILTLSDNIDALFNYCYSYRESNEPTSDKSNLSSLFDMGMKLVEEKSTSDEETTDLAHEAPIAKLVDNIIHQAISEKASDIHIEPEETSLKIRFRIDGILKDIMSPPKKLETTIISRLKLLADLDITETRKPQDGRISFTYQDKTVDFRVSTVRTICGEKMVLRILDKSGSFVMLDKLGLNKNQLNLLNSLIQSSSGIIIVCGPTGSGKTSTLYSSLNKINSPDKNIITIEDPVEFNLDGINQIPANPKIGVDFVTALTAIVRQDPDVIMIGEVRDYETANIAIQAALTGHLVLTTLHTRSAAGTITRLLDMGAKPFLLNSSIIGVISQRLVRCICSNCKKEVPVDNYKSLRQLEIINYIQEKYPHFKLYKGSGCKTCDHTGYVGRIGIFEIMTMHESIRSLVIQNASSEEINKSAIANGMLTIKEDGVQKVLSGKTTLEELTRVLDV